MNQITTPPGDGAEPKQSARAGTAVASSGGATGASGGQVAADAVPTRQEAAPGRGPGTMAPAAPERARVDPALDRRRGRLALMLGVALVVLVGALVALGAWSHSRTSASAAQALQQQNDAVPQVRVAAVKVLDGPRRIELPGNMQAFDAATLYARSTGYVAKRNVDIGSKVHAGDVLAVIASPDVDQQYAQAQAQLAQTAAAFAQA